MVLFARSEFLYASRFSLESKIRTPPIWPVELSLTYSFCINPLTLRYSSALLFAIVRISSICNPLLPIKMRISTRIAS